LTNFGPHPGVLKPLKFNPKSQKTLF
jgi:hypothetical protein